MTVRREIGVGCVSIAVWTAFISGVHAAPIDAGVFTIRDNETNNSIGTGIGDNFSIGVFSVTPDSTEGTTARARNEATGIEFELESFPELGRPGIFGVEYSYAEAQAQNLLGPWTITLSNDVGTSDTTVLVTQDATDLEQMETVKKLAVTGPSTAPKISWELPTEGPPVTQVRYEIWNDDDNVVLTGQLAIDLDSNAVSLELPNPQLPELTPGTGYAARIIVVNQDGGATTRSSNWINWTATEASPSGNVAQLTTGSPVTLSQTVDVPSDPFTLAFDYKFLTDTGALSLSLDGIAIGPVLEAPSSIGAGFSRAFFDVDVAEILGRDSALLSFLLDGPTGSTVLLDNISFPGLAAGGFEDLGPWVAGGQGTVSLTAVPLPGALPLTIGAFALLCFGVRKRAVA